MKNLPGVLLACASTAAASACTTYHGYYQLAPDHDVTIVQGDPTNHGSDPLLAVGRDANDKVNRTLLRFDVPGLSIADSRLVRSAGLSILAEGVTTSGSFDIELRAIGSSFWTEAGATGLVRPVPQPQIHATTAVNPNHWFFFWDVTDLIRGIIDGVYPAGGFELSPSAPASGFVTMHSKEYPDSIKPWLLIDSYELTLDVDDTGVPKFTASETRTGVVHFLYAGTQPGTTNTLMMPLDGNVDIDAAKLVLYGKASSSTWTSTVNLATSFPGASTVHAQLIARDGDWMMLSNPVEVNLNP